MKGIFAWPARSLNFVREQFNRPPRQQLECLSRFVEVDLERQGTELQISLDGLRGDLLVVITTCDRPRQLCQVLECLRASLERAHMLHRASILILEDVTDSDYRPAYEMKDDFPGGFRWVRSLARLGKRGYFITYQVAFSYAQKSSAERILFLQDDLVFDEQLVRSSYDLLESLSGEMPGGRPIVLNLYASDDDEEDGRWIEFRRESHPTLPVRRTQWFDLNGYLVGREVLAALDFRLIPIHQSRWHSDPNLSSGVGRQLTRRLFQRADVFQCYPPLIFHGREPSVMNPEARKLRSLDNFSLRKAAS